MEVTKKQKINALIEKHIGSVNSFIDRKGDNHLPFLVDDLDALMEFKNQEDN